MKTEPTTEPVNQPKTFGPAVNLPFVGTIDRPASEAGKTDKQTLVFGPYLNSRGGEMLNATRGKTDKTVYEAGKTYFVRLEATCFNNRLYFSTI